MYFVGVFDRGTLLTNLQSTLSNWHGQDEQEKQEKQEKQKQKQKQFLGIGNKREKWGDGVVGKNRPTNLLLKSNQEQDLYVLSSCSKIFLYSPLQKKQLCLEGGDCGVTEELLFQNAGLSTTSKFGRTKQQWPISEVTYECGDFWCNLVMLMERVFVIVENPFGLEMTKQFVSLLFPNQQITFSHSPYDCGIAQLFELMAL